MKLVHAPAEDPRLARAFPDASTRAWTLERTCGAELPASFAIEDDAGRWLAGLSVSPRVVTGGGAPERVGVLAGIWATPEARGKGTFEQLLDGAIAQATADGARCLLGFMTEHNPHRRKLEARGATLTPTSYAAAAPLDAPRGEGAITASEADAEMLRVTLLEARRGTRSFAYDDADAFRGQFLDRPRRASACVVAGTVAIVEVQGGQNHVLAVLSADADTRRAALAELRHAASRAGQRLGVFAVGLEQRADLEAQGFRVTRGVVARVPCAEPESDADDAPALALEQGDLP